MSEPGNKVLLAMSGGVDSSVAAVLLRRQGYDVVGCFMRLGSPGDELEVPIPAEKAACTKPAKLGHQGCCSVSDAADARLVAAQLGIPLYVCNFRADFGRVMDYFVDEYAAGRTPNPCVRCNDWLKFGRLHDLAAQLGAGFVATGHYARVERTAGASRLLRGVDTGKDQSYVLFGMEPARLERTLLPIGALRKSEVRLIAQQEGLPVFDKPDSQEICFVPGDDYRAFVEERRPEAARAGHIIDEAGRVVGAHGGQHRFTIGQRRGVGVALGHPVYVVAKDAAANTVTVGPEEMLLAGSCVAEEVNWLVAPAPATDGVPCMAKFRSNSAAVSASFRMLSDGSGATPSGRRGRLEVRFEQAQAAVAPGQAIVIYSASEPDVVLGGGWVRAVSAPGA